MGQSQLKQKNTNQKLMYNDKHSKEKGRGGRPGSMESDLSLHAGRTQSNSENGGSRSDSRNSKSVEGDESENQKFRSRESYAQSFLTSEFTGKVNCSSSKEPGPEPDSEFIANFKFNSSSQSNFARFSTFKENIDSGELTRIPVDSSCEKEKELEPNCKGQFQGSYSKNCIYPGQCGEKIFDINRDASNPETVTGNVGAELSQIESGHSILGFSNLHESGSSATNEISVVPESGRRVNNFGPFRTYKMPDLPSVRTPCGTHGNLDQKNGFPNLHGENCGSKRCKSCNSGELESESIISRKNSIESKRYSKKSLSFSDRKEHNFTTSYFNGLGNRGQGEYPSCSDEVNSKTKLSSNYQEHSSQKYPERNRSNQSTKNGFTSGPGPSGNRSPRGSEFLNFDYHENLSTFNLNIDLCSIDITQINFLFNNIPEPDIRLCPPSVNKFFSIALNFLCKNYVFKPSLETYIRILLLPKLVLSRQPISSAIKNANILKNLNSKSINFYFTYHKQNFPSGTNDSLNNKLSKVSNMLKRGFYSKAYNLLSSDDSFIPITDEVVEEINNNFKTIPDELSDKVGNFPTFSMLPDSLLDSINSLNSSSSAGLSGWSPGLVKLNKIHREFQDFLLLLSK